MFFPKASDVSTTATGCCIRFGPDGIYLHHNDAHYAVGVVEGALTLDTKDRLVIRHSSAGEIVTMGAFADESLVSRGIALGPSGGTGKTVIAVAKNGVALDLRKPSDYAQVSGEYCNAWIFWLHATPRDAQ